MPMREFYTVDRSPEEVRALWDWAAQECRGKIEHESPYAMGALAVLEYLMGETEERPQDYKGLFTLQNMLRQTQEGQHVRGVGHASVHEPLYNGLNPLRPGNPKCFLYKDE